MFKTNASTRFETSTSKKEVFSLLEEELNSLGSTEISDKGTIRINGSKNSSFSHDVEIEGRIKEKEGKYSVEIDINVKPQVVVWIVAICTFPLGLAILFLPYSANSELKKKAERALENLKSELK